MQFDAAMVCVHVIIAEVALQVFSQTRRMYTAGWEQR